ncbi:MAG: ion transporter, partial [Candidatus Celaenobacter polaris]|nr:ion transporter [Candidatus Celaenobacter polaris]
MNSFRETIQFYLVDSKTPLGKLIDVFIIILNFVICAILVVETYDLSETVHSILWNTEIVIVAFFIIEYAARLYGSKNRLKQLVDIYSVIDLIAILPTVALLVCPIFGIALNVGFL